MALARTLTHPDLTSQKINAPLNRNASIHLVRLFLFPGHW